MGGGLMQLVAYGAQDIYLTGNPQITFFKVVYRRHTNFSMEAIEQTWNGSSTETGQCTATISRNGDLVHRMYIEITQTNGNLWDTTNPGAHFVNTVELEIGGQKIDKHSGQWMETWAELTEPNPTGCGWNANAGVNGTLFQKTTGMGSVEISMDTSERLFIPLQFWFCRNPGLALPLIALQYHEVKVILNQRASVVDAGSFTGNSLWCDYIYLDTDERRRFAQVSHEYLIEQVQEQSCTNSQTNDLNFNHPVKELIWTGVWGIGASNSTPIPGADKWQLKLNGHDRFAERDHRYFTRVQVWQHHSGPGGLGVGGTASEFNDSIAVYSFALKPEEHQPSGTCNFSRIDNAQLMASSVPGAAFVVFAVNYNVLRIMSGMGGLAYSN
jgi:hypothetical protein